jgi:hypothetical protein
MYWIRYLTPKTIPPIGTVPDNVVILGIQVENINSSIGLSESVENNLLSLEDTIKGEIEAMIKKCTNCH